jgi:hypothetical protein
MTETAEESGVVHIMYAGRNFDYPTDEFDIGSESSHSDIKRAIADKLSVPLEKLDDYDVDLTAYPNVTLRANATFG